MAIRLFLHWPWQCVQALLMLQFTMLLGMRSEYPHFLLMMTIFRCLLIPPCSVESAKPAAQFEK